MYMMTAGLTLRAVARKSFSDNVVQSLSIHVSRKQKTLRGIYTLRVYFI